MPLLDMSRNRSFLVLLTPIMFVGNSGIEFPVNISTCDQRHELVQISGPYIIYMVRQSNGLVGPHLPYTDHTDINYNYYLWMVQIIGRI